MWLRVIILTSLPIFRASTTAAASMNLISDYHESPLEPTQTEIFLEELDTGRRSQKRLAEDDKGVSLLTTFHR